MYESRKYGKRSFIRDITVYLDNYDWNEDGSNNLYDIQANNPLGKEMCERLENIPGVKNKYGKVSLGKY